jgi:hypothetical protein
MPSKLGPEGWEAAIEAERGTYGRPAYGCPLNMKERVLRTLKERVLDKDMHERVLVTQRLYPHGVSS